MELEIKDRLLLLMLLPEHGDLDTIRIIHDLKTNLSFSEQEHKEWNLQRDEDGTYTWDKNTANKDVEIGEKALEIVRTELNRLSDQGRVTEKHLGLFNKFHI
jgi:predicted RNA-binding protein with PUA domain|tara:strand:+ start:4540 stop:4845 length:306 start_codon:yes stop_codon:yes gene_type:complete